MKNLQRLSLEKQLEILTVLNFAKFEFGQYSEIYKVLKSRVANKDVKNFSCQVSS